MSHMLSGHICVQNGHINSGQNLAKFSFSSNFQSYSTSTNSTHNSRPRTSRTDFEELCGDAFRVARLLPQLRTRVETAVSPHRGAPRKKSSRKVDPAEQMNYCIFKQYKELLTSAFYDFVNIAQSTSNQPSKNP